MLNDLGLITTLGPRREGVRFDANLEPHHHFVCVRCGLARDFESTSLDGLRVPEVVKGFGSAVATQSRSGASATAVQGTSRGTMPGNAKRPRGRERSTG